jgi:membrane protein
MNRKELLVVSRNTLKEFDKDDVSLLAAALTYYSFLSLFPLLLLAVTLAGIFLKPEDATKLIFQDVARVIPGATALLSEAVAEAFRNRANAGWLALAGIAILAFSASGAFGTLDKAINRAWGTEKVPGFLVSRLVSFVMMLGVAGLLVLSLMVSTVLTRTRAVTSRLIGEVPGSQVFWQLVTTAVSLGLVFLVFLLMYWFIPRAGVHVRDAWPGALLASVAWVVLKELYALFLGSQFATYDAVYGTVGAVIALLTWIYLSSMIILGGAEFASETQRVRKLRADLRGAGKQDQESPWFERSRQGYP